MSLEVSLAAQKRTVHDTRSNSSSWLKAQEQFIREVPTFPPIFSKIGEVIVRRVARLPRSLQPKVRKIRELVNAQKIKKS